MPISHSPPPVGLLYLERWFDDLANSSPAVGHIYLERFIDWVKEIWAPIVTTLRPDILKNRIIPIPTVATYATYEMFRSFVNNDLSNQLDLAETNITLLDNTTLQPLKAEISRMINIIDKVLNAKAWIKTHEAEYAGKEIEAVQINRTLLRSVQLTSQLVKKIPDSFIKTKRPGIRNESGTDCFMNTILQIILGDPAACKRIALNENQNEVIKRHALSYILTCMNGQDSPLIMAQAIRALSAFTGGVNRNLQGDIDEAFGVILDPLSEKEYNKGNPFIHKIIRKNRYENIDIDKLAVSARTLFKGKSTIERNFQWRHILNFNFNPESNTIESLIECSLRPTNNPDFVAMFDHADGTRKPHTCTSETCSFEKRPERLFFFLNRKNRGRDQNYIKSSEPTELQNFYLEPKLVENGKGGEYEIYSFGIHTGNVDKKGGSSGHYEAYLKIDDSHWNHISDSTSEIVDDTTAKNAFRTGWTFINSRLVNRDLSNKVVTRKAKENIDAAIIAKQETDTAKKIIDIGAGKLDPPRGCSPIKKAGYELGHVKFFNKILKENRKVEDLVKVFEKTSVEFQMFAYQVLILEGKMEKNDKTREHLQELKTIMTPYLIPQSEKKSIVDQYCSVSEANLKLSISEYKSTQTRIKSLSLMIHPSLLKNHTDLMSIQARSQYVKEVHNTLKVLIERQLERDVVLLLGEILLPGLRKLLEKYEGVQELGSITVELDHLLDQLSKLQPPPSKA